jgi:hypothetical protein
MEKPMPKQSVPDGPRFRGGLAAALSLLMILGLAAWGYARAAASLAACDAISSASCSVTGIKTTTTSAYIYWKEKNNSGTMQFCYGTTALTTCTTNISDRGSSNVYTLANLKADTKYIFKFYGTFRTWHYTASGSFITDGTTCGGPSTSVTAQGIVLSSSGDSLPGVIATAKTAANGTVVDVDTSNRSGQFIFDLAAGEYVISLAYPNYTMPAPFAATVVAGTDLTLPTQTLTDAFQIGGTVVNKKGDSLPSVEVTAYKSSDNSLAARTLTDAEGYFSFGLKTGGYVLKFLLAPYPPPSVDLTVSKSQEIAKVVLEQTTGLGNHRGARTGGRAQGFPETAYDAKGKWRKDAPPTRLFTAP